MKVFKVATGKVVAVCKVKGKMVCWNISGNKLAVVTNADEVGKGRRVVYFDIQVSPIPSYLQHLTSYVTIFVYHHQRYKIGKFIKYHFFKIT